MSSDNTKNVSLWQLPRVQAELSARAEAENQTDLEETLKQAYEDAFAQGLREGREAAQKEIDTEVNRLKETVNALQWPLKIVDQAMQEQLINLCLAICEQLLHQALRTNPDHVVQFVQQALQSLPEYRPKCIVYVSGADREILEKYQHEWDKQATLEFRLDNSLQCGEFRIDSQHTSIDGRLSKRLSEIAVGILEP